MAKSYIKHTKLILMALASYVTVTRADYFSSQPYYYNSSRLNGPIISLELDERKSRNQEMRLAARENRPTDLLREVRAGADVNSKSDEGDTALIYAGRNCSVDSTEILLKHHVDINAQDLHGNSALMAAVLEGCLPITKLLLSIKNIQLNLRDDQHLTALDYARQGASLDVDGPPTQILKLLIKATQKEHFEALPNSK